MDLSKHKDITNQLLSMVTPENQATACELLTQLSEDYSETTATLTAHAENIETLTKNNETLREVNAKLFLKVGSSEPVPNVPNPSEPVPEGSETQEIPTYDSLFNEKGELL